MYFIRPENWIICIDYVSSIYKFILLKKSKTLIIVHREEGRWN
jgi:hypothetical protein